MVELYGYTESWYSLITIQLFGINLTKKIFFGSKDKEVFKFPRGIFAVVECKLDMIQAAQKMQDLSLPPANRLEKLKRDMNEFWCIRVEPA